MKNHLKRLTVCMLALLMCATGLPALAAPNDATFPGDTYAIASAARVGEVLYLLGSNALYSYQVGDAAPQKVLELPDREVSEIAKAKPQPGLLVSDGEKLLAIDLYGGLLGTFDGATFTWGTALDWGDLSLGGDSPRSIGSCRYTDGAIYVLSSAGANGMLMGMPVELARFDPATGQRTQMQAEALTEICAYKPGQLLGVKLPIEWTSNSLPDPEVVILNSTTGAQEGSAGKLVGYDAGALAYDAGTDTVYACAQNQVMASVKGAAFAPVAYLSTPSASGVNAAVLPGPFYVLASRSHIIVRNADPQYMTGSPLRIRGLGVDPKLIDQFTRDNPDIPVVKTQSFDMTSEQLVAALQDDQNPADIFVMVTLLGMESMKDKGYLTDLSDTPELADMVARMYPEVQKALMKDGKIYGVPANFVLSGWRWNQPKMEELGLTIPTTMNEYYQLVGTWEEDYAEDYPELTLVPLTTGKAGLFSQALNEYLITYETADAPITFDTPAFREVLSTIADLPVEDVDLEELRKNPMALLSAPQKEALIEPMVYDMFNQYGKRDEETAKPLTEVRPPLPFTPDTPARSMAQLIVYVINPRTKNMEQAKTFIEYATRHMADETRVAVLPDDNEPVRDPDYEEGRKRLEQQLAEAKTRLDTADAADKQALENRIAEMQKVLDNAEQLSWSLSAENIAAYRQLAPHMNLLIGSVIMNMDNQAGLEEFNKIAQRYIDGEMPMEQALRELDKKAQMMYLEGR